MNTQKIHVWFDLEETLIDSFQNFLPRIEKINFIKRQLSSIKVDSFNVFSFAIYDDSDKSYFLRQKGDLERLLDLKSPMVQVPSVNDLAKLFGDYEAFDFTTLDIIRIFGKKIAFEKYISEIKDRSNELHILFDDTVPNATINYDDDNLTIKYIRVD